MVLTLSACASVGTQVNSQVGNQAPSEKVSFKNPPAVGDWLKSQRDLVACETQAAAQFMSNFGFLHPQCQQLIAIGEREYQVIKRKQIELPEGPVWLLDVKRTPMLGAGNDAENGTDSGEAHLYYVPVPWHDWL